jgi:hypothetical protein
MKRGRNGKFPSSHPLTRPSCFVSVEHYPLAALLVAYVVLSAVVTWIASRIISSRNMNLLRVTAVARPTTILSSLSHRRGHQMAKCWPSPPIALETTKIYVRRIDGGQEVNVTNDPGQDFQPDFSPDGNSIAFVSTRFSRTGMVKLFGARGSSSEIHILGGDVWVVPALGGQAHLLARDGNFPAWHPSGSKILYVSGLEDHRSLMEVSAGGGTPRPVLPGEISNWEIVGAGYSPTGRWIAFETSGRQVFILPANGGAPRELLNDVSYLVWDWSGKRIYYCTPELSGGTRLRATEIDEDTGKLKGKPQTVALLTGILKDLAISRDGHHLAASEMEGSLNLTRLPLNADGDGLCVAAMRLRAADDIVRPVRVLEALPLNGVRASIAASRRSRCCRSSLRIEAATLLLNGKVLITGGTNGVQKYSIQ